MPPERGQSEWAGTPVHDHTAVGQVPRAFPVGHQPSPWARGGTQPTYLSPGNGELLLTLLTVSSFIIFQPSVALGGKHIDD